MTSAVQNRGRDRTPFEPWPDATSQADAHAQSDSATTQQTTFVGSGDPMRSLRSVALAALPVLLLGCGGAVDGVAATQQPIVNGTADTAEAFPNVGTIVTPDGQGGWTSLCSGVMASPSVFLTAGHCVQWLIVAPGLDHGEYGVSFDPVFDAANGFVTGVAHTSFPSPDIGVIVLDEAQSGPFATVPKLNLLRDMQREGELARQRFTAVGYGVTSNGPHWIADAQGTRRIGTLQFDALDGRFMHVRMYPADDLGGICFGDSGGPQFFEGTMELAAITINAHKWCQATAWSQRLDLPGVHQFLAPYGVPLP